MLALNMGNLLACTHSSSVEADIDSQHTPGPEELLGYGDLSSLKLARAASEDAALKPNLGDDKNSKGLGLTHMFSDEAEMKNKEYESVDAEYSTASAPAAPTSSSSTASKIVGWFTKKSKKATKAEKKAAAKAQAFAPAAVFSAPAKKFVDDRKRFGLAPLTSVTNETLTSIAAMSLPQLLAQLGTLSGVKSVRLAEVERLAREAEARVKEVERAEAALKAPPVKVAPVSASVVVAAPVVPVAPSQIVVGAAAPVAPALTPDVVFAAQVAPAPAVQKKPWAKGVGYGYHGAAGSWNIDTYMAELKVKQQSMQFVCRKVSDKLDNQDEEATVELFAQSTFLPFLESYLCNDSMNEILEQHSDLYSDIFALVAHVLAFQAPKVSPLVSLLQPKIAGFLKKIAKSAKLIESIDNKAPAKAEAAQVASATSSSSSSTSALPTTTAAAPVSTLTSYVIELSQTLEDILALPKEQPVSVTSPVALDVAIEPSTDRESSVSSASSSLTSSSSSDDLTEKKEGDKPSESALTEYVKVLSEFRFGEVEQFDYHKYQKEKGTSASSAPISRTFTRRLAVEYADLAESLPIHFDSSVWMRVHESNMQYAQMMISGPDNTPYENGLFLFDVHFPPTYPAVPPCVNLQTTGKASVRFNPNLYHCGKVCLSILGTWSGGVGEGWSVKSSTMLQVAVSIQSLIFVPEPYFNEPGYESTMHTKEGQIQSDAYSQPLLHGTMKWAILDQLQHPPTGFKEIVHNHFRLKKDKILKQAEEWAKKNAEITSLIPELKKEFAKLEKPQA